MNYGKDAFVIFEDAQTLLGALHYCLKTDEQFPATVLKTEFGLLAVPLNLLDGRFAAEAKKHGWAHKVAAHKPRGDRLPLDRLIAGREEEWRYRDPHVPAAPDGVGRADDGRPLITRYNPRAEMDYLLAASDDREAERLLRVLTGMLTQGIRAVSLGAEGQPPFRFFWAITSDRPPTTALHAAARAWWGPVGRGEVTIYKEWPYDWEIADQLLHRVPWGVPDGVVLLSRSAPHVIKLARDANGTFERELTKVARLRVGEVRQARASDSDSPDRFDVDLRLTPSSLLRRLPERVTELERQVKAKQLLLERMREDLYDDVRPEPLPQPLFFYYPERDRPLEIPSHLRRLLIEWAGQSANGRESDLASLRYLKLDAAESLPPGMDGDASEIHVLTTAAALGGGQGAKDDTVGLQLLDYQPTSGGVVWFELLHEWADFQLYLFTPHERGLNLYPRFRPGPYAAEKLGQALLGARTSEWRQCAFLLIPTPEGRLSVCHIRRDQFRPFAREVEWECALDVSRYPLRAVETQIKQHGEQMLSTLEETFTRSARERAEALLKKSRDEEQARIDAQWQRQKEHFEEEDRNLEKEREREQGELDLRRKEVAEVRQQVRRLGPLLEQFDRTVGLLRQAQEEFLREADAANVEADAVQVLLTRHISLLSELKTAEHALAASKKALSGWRKK